MITFPTTTTAFVAYQEAEIRRKLNDIELKFSEAVVDLANNSYQEGVDGEENSTTISLVKEFFRVRGKELSANELHVFESICWWCDEAYKQGEAASA